MGATDDAKNDTIAAAVAFSPNFYSDQAMVVVICNASGVDLSVWCYEKRWEGIYSNQSADANYIIRIAPDGPDIIYLADLGGTEVYFSSSGGQDKWFTRVYKETTGVKDTAIA